MRKTKEYKASKDIETRLALQQRIHEKFGEETIQKARSRLCENCWTQSNCFLLPICFDGKDCPYFKKKEQE